jgi:hypothetical protein
MSTTPGLIAVTNPVLGSTVAIEGSELVYVTVPDTDLPTTSIGVPATVVVAPTVCRSAELGFISM